MLEFGPLCLGVLVVIFKIPGNMETYMLNSICKAAGKWILSETSNLGSSEYLRYFPVAPSTQKIGHHILPNVTSSTSDRAKHPIRLAFAISPNCHDATHYNFYVVHCFQLPQLENHQLLYT